MTRNCGICKAESPAYQCPRCNLPYCSSNCYKNLEKHGECSESFYQEQVITELKNMNFNDNESRAKIVDILKKEAKKMCEDDSLMENENQKDEISSTPDENDLVKQYINEVLNWKPWLKMEEFSSLSFIIEINSDKDKNSIKLNTKLLENSRTVSTLKSSPYLYVEILKNIFIYQICLYTYQLRLDDFDLSITDQKIDICFVQEICNSYLEIEDLVNKLVAKGPEIKQQFETLLKVLSSEPSYFLKPYTNSDFFLNLVEELEYIQQRPKIIFKVISHLYDMFYVCVKKKDIIEKENIPTFRTNVFHFNKKTTMQQITKSFTRTKIIKEEVKTKKNESLSGSKFSCRDYKIFMKKLEFYFKWFEENMGTVINVDKCCQIKNDLNLVRQKFELEAEKFKQQKELIDKNLNKIRPKTKLIEEIESKV